MIKIEARIIENVMEIEDEGTKFIARPTGWDEKGLKGAWKRFTTMKYMLFDKDEKTIGNVEYDGKKDEIVIDQGKEVYRTKHLWFKPDEFQYKGELYLLHEKLTGVIVITQRKKVVATGEIKGYYVVPDHLHSWRIPGKPDENDVARKMSKFLERVAAKGKVGFTTVKFFEYDEKLKDVLKFLGTGYCIKMLLFQMFI